MFSLNVPEKYSNSVYNTIRPFYICSRLFGYSPFSATITRPSSNKIYLTKLDNFIFVVHLAVYVLCAVFNSAYEFNLNMSSSKLLTLGTKITCVLGIYVSCVLLFVELVYRTYCWQIVESLNDFDIELQKLGKTINHSKHRKLIEDFIKVWSSVSLIFVIYTFVIFAQYSKLLLPLSLYLSSYILITGTFGIFATTYSFFILSLKVRFEILNNSLSDECQFLNQIKIIDSNNKGEPLPKITQMAQLHDKLNDIIGLVNRRYSFQVMLLVAADFTFSVLSLYSLYRACSWTASSVEQKQFFHSTIHVIWSIYYNFFIIIVIWSGSSIRSEGEYTGVLIHRVINSCTNQYSIEKLSLFSQQLKHQAPIATCKLFVFDWTLFYTIVGAVATYLTILIQFDSSLGGNNYLNETNY